MLVDVGRILALSLFLLVTILIGQTKSQEKSTNTEDDNNLFFDNPEYPNEKFNQRFYQKAQSHVATNWWKMSAKEANDFSKYTSKLEDVIFMKMAEILGLQNNPNVSTLSTNDMANIFQENMDKGDVTSAELLTLQMYTLAMQEAYVKQVIEVFKLKPQDLGTTPQYFCEVFKFCEFVTSKTTTTSTTTKILSTLPPIKASTGSKDSEPEIPKSGSSRISRALFYCTILILSQFLFIAN